MSKAETPKKPILTKEEEQQAAVDIMQVGAVIANLMRKTGMDRSSAIVSLGMATRMLLSEELIKAALSSEETQLKVQAGDNLLDVPQLNDKLVDLAIRSFSSGLSSTISITVARIDSRVFEQPAPGMH